jgi:hypothetical protein
MRTYTKLLISGCLLALPLQAVATEEKGAAEKSKQPQVATVPASAAKASAYKPPLRGAPSGRVGGGTRGATERESFSLLVLAPDHVGYTTQTQPCLYWFISKPTSFPVELTIAERKAVKPLLEKVLKPAEKAGVQSVCLTDLGVTLKKNIQYKWFVTLVTDSEHRSKDILAGGIIELIDPSPALAAKLGSADVGKAYGIYAEEGIWYDALQAISGNLDAAPGNAEIRQERATLLRQVGLVEVAEFEKSRPEGQ